MRVSFSLFLVASLTPSMLCGQHPAAKSTAQSRAGTTPPLMDMKAVTVGVGPTAGLAGLEVVRRRDLQAFTGVGVGLGGIGGRLGYAPFERAGQMHTWIPYVSVEAVFAPWRLGPLHKGGGVGVMVGWQKWGAERDWMTDVGFGVLQSISGTWFGSRTLPMVRVALGRGRPH